MKLNPETIRLFKRLLKEYNRDIEELNAIEVIPAGIGTKDPEELLHTCILSFAARFYPDTLEEYNSKYGEKLLQDVIAVYTAYKTADFLYTEGYTECKKDPLQMLKERKGSKQTKPKKEAETATEEEAKEEPEELAQSE